MADFKPEDRKCRIEALESVAPITLGAEDFDAGKDLLTLIKEQGVKPLKSLKKLQGLIGPEESFDETLEEIYAARG